MTDTTGSLERDFLRWEIQSRDVIDVKRCYIDLAGDLIGGILLSQIIYWFLPNSRGGSKLLVERDGKRWLAKSRDSWWDECRITAKQFDRSIEKLAKLELVETRLMRFGSTPIKHISLRIDTIVRKLSISTKEENRENPIDTPISTFGENPILPKGENRELQGEIDAPILPKGANLILTKGENGLSRKGEMDFTQTGKSTIGKTTTETTRENPPSRARELASTLLKRLYLPESEATKQAAALAIAAYASEIEVDPAEAAQQMEVRARMAQSRGASVNRWWFEDGKYRGGVKFSAEASVGCEKGRCEQEPQVTFDELPEGLDASLAEFYWPQTLERLSISGNINRHSFDTWFKRTWALGVIGGVLYVGVPGREFLHISTKYGQLLEQSLPEGVQEVRFLVAREKSLYERVDAEQGMEIACNS